jgi:arylsulfatase
MTCVPTKTSFQLSQRRTGDADLVEKLKKGHTLNSKPFKVHLDGYNLLPFLQGAEKESPRKEFFYWSDDGDLMAIRVREWKIAFLEQHVEVNPQTQHLQPPLRSVRARH